MNILRKKLSKDTLYTEYSKILNGVLQLSKREVEVFSFLLKADAEGNKDNINTRQIRTDIINTYKISEANLSRYLGVLKDKGLILKGNNGKLILNDLVRPIVMDTVLELKFLLEIV
jgi:predicted transcriptional regulator